MVGALLLAAATATAALTLDAETTTYDGATHTYTASGHVRIQWGTLAVTCDRAELVMAADERSLARATFTGHAQATRGTDSLAAARIGYDVRARRLVAEGAAHVRIALPDGGPPPLLRPAPTPSPR